MARAENGILCVLALVLAAAPAAAMDDPQELEEVLVPGRSSGESRLDVPVSVVVVGEAQLESMARMEDLALSAMRTTPAALVDGLSIRGIGAAMDFGAPQSVSLLIDGVSGLGSRASRTPLLDTKQMVFFKGPQPIHVGRNATAGALAIETNKPEREPYGALTVYQEFGHGETMLTAVLNSPMGEHSAVRFAGRWRELKGYMSNTADGSKGPQQRDGMFRLSLRTNPFERLTLDAKVEYASSVTIGTANQYVRCLSGALGNPRLVNPLFEDCRMDDTRSLRYDPAAFGAAADLFDDPDRPAERFDNQVLSGLLAAEWESAAGYTIRTRIGYLDQEFRAWVKPDFSWNQRMLAGFGDPARLVSQELRVDSPAGRRWFWTLGGYHEDVARDNVPFTQVSLQDGIAIRANRVEDSASWAAFGETGLRPVEALTLRVGGRYTAARTAIEADRSLYILSPSGPGADAWSYAVPTSVTLAPNGFKQTAQSRRDHGFTPAVTLEWRPRAGQMYFLGWREGHKAGGYSSYLEVPVDEIAFDPETVSYWEAGMKLRGAADRWWLSTAAFNGEYRDLQLYMVDARGRSVTRNAGGAHSRGVDLELGWAFAAGWRLTAGVFWLDAGYEDFRNAPCYPVPRQTLAQGCLPTGGIALPPEATVCTGNACAQDLSGFPTSFAPRWSGTLSLQYRRRLPVAEQMSPSPLVLSARMDVMATDSYYTSVNGGRGSMQEAFARLDAQLALGSDDGRWEVALVGRNLTNEIYGNWYEPLVRAGPDTGWQAATARPRQVALQMKIGF